MCKPASRIPPHGEIPFVLSIATITQTGRLATWLVSCMTVLFKIADQLIHEFSPEISGLNTSLKRYWGQPYMNSFRFSKSHQMYIRPSTTSCACHQDTKEFIKSMLQKVSVQMWLRVRPVGGTTFSGSQHQENSPVKQKVALCMQIVHVPLGSGNIANIAYALAILGIWRS